HLRLRPSVPGGGSSPSEGGSRGRAVAVTGSGWVQHGVGGGGAAVPGGGAGRLADLVRRPGAALPGRAVVHGVGRGEGRSGGAFSAVQRGLPRAAGEPAD